MGVCASVCASEFDYLLRLKQENEFLALLLRQFSIVEKAFQRLFICALCVFSLILSICGHLGSGDCCMTARLCILIHDDYVHPFQYNLYVSYYLRAFPYFSE